MRLRYEAAARCGAVTSAWALGHLRQIAEEVPRFGTGVLWPFGVFYVLAMTRVLQMDPLAGPYDRLRVVHDDIKSLEGEMDAACEREPSTLRHEFDPQERWHIYKAKPGKQSDPVWGIRAGAIMHNLRAALDEITWRLACAYTPALLTDQVLTDHKLAKHARQVQFPIFLHAHNPTNVAGISAFNGTGTSLQLRLIDKAHATLFESHQPYFGTNGGERDPLWILKEMNDADKHRVIHFTGVVLRGSDITFAWNPSMGPVGAHPPNVKEFRFTNPRDGFADEAEVCRVRYIDESQVNMNIKLTTEIRFDEACGSGSGLHVISALAAMYDRVARIVVSFNPLFP